MVPTAPEGFHMQRIALVTNKPTPYRIPVFERLAQMPDVVLQVIFCSEREPNRLWDLPPMKFDHVFLREHFSTKGQRYIHNNVDVLSALRRFAPDVVITTGFNPTQLYAFAYAVMTRAAHVTFTDGTLASENSLGKLHRLVRRIVFSRTGAYVSASHGGQKLYESYRIPHERCFQSCLAIDNDRFAPVVGHAEKRFDFIFCGRIEAVKNPMFALNVAHETARRLGRKTSILFAGSGSEENNIKSIASLESELVDIEFRGFAAQGELPALYQSARVFLFPTLWDPWGVVVNEACAAGLPVIASPNAGTAHELVRDGENGFVCELDVGIWADKAALLLSDEREWQRQSSRSMALVGEYSYDKAAQGLLDACRAAAMAAPPHGGRFAHDV
jgi:glycosyltransferase involved in cell wall biosynthesis